MRINGVPNSRGNITNKLSPNTDMEHSFLDLNAGVPSDRIHMGGMRLSTRINIYLFFSVFAAIIFAGMYVYVDQRVDQTLTHWRISQEIAKLIGRIETGVAKINGQEKEFSINKDTAAAEAFDLDIIAVSKALDKLYQLPESLTIQQPIATLRDGLVQYNEQFVGVVEAEKKLGIANTTGISARLKKTTRDLQTHFRQTDLANLSDQILRINRQGQETLSSGIRQGVDEIKKRYRASHALLEVVELSGQIKTEIKDYLTAHETDMLTLINQRLALDRDSGRFNDLLAYVAPSLELLAIFSKNQTVITSQALEKIQAFARYTIAGGSAAIITWLIFLGILLMRSMAGGIRSVAGSAQRISTGEKNVAVSGQGNLDAVGQIARALYKWSNDVTILDRLRLELEQTTEKLNLAISQADIQTVTAVEHAKAAFMAEVALEAEQTVYPHSSQPSLGKPINFDSTLVAEVDEAQAQENTYTSKTNASVPSPLIPNIGMSPISSVSQELAHFSEYVTAAAVDVERTEYLVLTLQDTTGQIESLSHLVTAVRDQTNLLAFHNSTQDQKKNTSESLIPFNDHGSSNRDKGPADHEVTQRFDVIRDATERAERTLQSIRISMQMVTSTANEIATTASNQALEATNKLLLQSEYLQSLLDDIITKMSPSRSVQAASSNQAVDKEDKPQGPFEKNPSTKL
jgi:hypothetical protein